MNFRLTIVLVAVFALLAGGVWYTELRGGPRTPTPPAGQVQLFDRKIEDVTRIEVDGEGKRTVVERGSDNVWRLVEPQPGEADNSTVDGAAGRLAKLMATRKLADPGNLADYGIPESKTTLKITFRDAGEQALLIGAQTPDKSSYYVMKSGDPAVYVVSSFSMGDLTRWAAEPPRPRPTPSPLPTVPLPPPTATGTGG